jgi:hypothetical protein
LAQVVAKKVERAAHGSFDGYGFLFFFAAKL